MKYVYATLILIFTTLSIHAQQLVKDINATIACIQCYTGSKISKMTNIGAKTYFVAEDATSGSEPWVTDGTAAGTHILRDINPGKSSSGVTEFVLSNGIVYFDAEDGTHGTELWRTDGTVEGTQMVKDIDILFSSPKGSFPHHLCDVDGVLYFVASINSTQDNGLWKTDGTAAGTVLVNNLEFLNFAPTDGPFSLFSFKGYLYFTEVLGNTQHLYRVDNLGTTTQIQKNVGATRNIIIDGTMYFRGYGTVENGAELWKTDGITIGLVKDIFPGKNSSSPDLLTNVNGTLFFTATDGVNGVELWKSDGTEAGTVMVKDITTSDNTYTHQPTFLTNVNGTLFFRGYTEASNYEIWKSDGTAAGTVMVKDILPGSGHTKIPAGLFNNNGTLLFSYGQDELWKSDGTASGTVLVKNMYYLQEMATVTNMPGHVVFYSEMPPGDNSELWMTDGTAAGTNLLKNIAIDNPASLYSRAGYAHVAEPFVHANGRLFFAAKNTIGEKHSLYSTKGTSVTTIKLDGEGFSQFWPTDAVNAGGYIYYTYSNVPTNSELWKSDGTAAGTTMVKEIRPGNIGSGPRNMCNVNGIIYFSADDGKGIEGDELWKTDGTEAGTVLVKDIKPGPLGSKTDEFINFNGLLFFLADDGIHGTELWKSDGTADGTKMIKDIAPGNVSSIGGLASRGKTFTIIGNELFFVAYTSYEVSWELWKTDGTEQGTVLVKDIMPDRSETSSPRFLTAVGNKLFFVADNFKFGINDELWVSDGTTSGTFLVKEINPGTEGSYPCNLINLNGVLYFSAFEPGTGYELWKSDGTSAGTEMVKDIEPGVQSGLQSGEKAGLLGVSHFDVTKANGFLYFPATTGATGRELWKSDGTEAGTVMVKDLFPGPQSSDPEQVTAANGDIYFVAEDGTTGKELYVYKPIIDIMLPPGDGQNVIDINWQNIVLVEGTNQIIATIKQSGLRPLNDSVHVTQKVEANAFTYNGRTLAKKHVDIEPAQNAATATATVMLYFSQADFNDYNLADNLNGDLPTAPGDLVGKANLRIIQFHGEGTQPGNYPGTEVMIDPADDSIVWNAANNYWEINFSVSGFSGFYLSSTTSVLPVRLISFKGLLNADKHVDLDWKVAEQQGIVSYEIEKSTTGNDFDKIGFVTANNQNSFTYHFADDRPFSGTVFYRLKIIEQDGGFNYSQIISVNYVASNAVKLYPIPAGSIIYLKLNDEKFIDSDAIILDISGKTVKRFTINSILQNIDISLLASGTYYLHLINGPAIKFQKL